MQKLFQTQHSPSDYQRGISGNYPDAPKRCPQKGCRANVMLRKHGYYKRNLITINFVGMIMIRRYRCPVCGKTLSMLPAFCTPRFQYAVKFIALVLTLMFNGVSTRKLERRLQKWVPTAERKLFRFYRQRLKENRGFIQYGINQISPEHISLGNIPGTETWARRFLREIKRHNQTNGFNVQFHNTTEKSFMTLQTRIA
jgi:hypothetical protein